MCYAGGEDCGDPSHGRDCTHSTVVSLKPKQRVGHCSGGPRRAGGSPVILCPSRSVQARSLVHLSSSLNAGTTSGRSVFSCAHRMKTQET